MYINYSLSYHTMNKSIITSLFTEPWYLDKPFRVIGNLYADFIMKNKEKNEAEYLASINYFPYSESNKKIAIIPLSGIVRKYGYGSTSAISDLLDGMEQDDSIAGVVFLTDSPGGMASGTGMLAEKIFNFKKPTASYIKGLSCSAAYYINAATDKIFVDKNADWVGSIGTLISFIDWVPLFEKFGAKYYEIYSSFSSEKNKSFRDLVSGNPEKLREEIDTYAKDFITHMQTFRKNMDEDVFKGGTWRPKEAVKKRLADAIGNLQDAIDYIAQKSKINSNQNNMAEKKYPKIASILGLEVSLKSGFLFGQKTVNLSENQLDLIENALSSNLTDETVNSLSTDKKNLEQKLSDNLNQIENIKKEITASLKNCNLTGTGTIVEDIKLLSSKVIEYGRRDGEIPTSVYSSKDKEDAPLENDILTNNYKFLYNK